jgi:hypothetical protein
MDKTTLRGMEQAGKDAILAKHNELRRTLVLEPRERYIQSYRVAKGEQGIQPAASNMRELVWDDELETIAQR